MPQNYFITGQPKAGKTTLLKDLVKELRKDGLRIGGFLSPEERHHGTRTAFFVMDVESGKKAKLADVKGDGPKVSKYHVDVKSFESIAVPSMEKFDSYDVYVIDEIGIMEMKSLRFTRLLDQILESDTPLIATLNDEYLDLFGGSGLVLSLDQDNRQAVYLRILRKAKESIKRKPAAEEKKVPLKAKKPEKAAVARKAEEKPAKKAPRGHAAPKKESAPAKKEPPKKEEPAAVERHEETRAKEKHDEKKKENIVDRIKRLLGS